MSITSLKFTSLDETSIQVTSEDGSSYSAPWPCHTWHREEIEAAIAVGMTIEPYMTESEKKTEQVEYRKNEIQLMLNSIDLESVRPLRAKVAGVAAQVDDERLKRLEEQAEILRVELASLG